MKDEAQVAAGAAAAGYCTQYGPTASAACGWAASEAAGAIYDEISSLGGGGCSGPLCDVPPPEETRPAAWAAYQDVNRPNRSEFHYIPNILASASYKPSADTEINGLKAGTLRRTLESILYLRYATGQPLTPVVDVQTGTHVNACPAGQAYDPPWETSWPPSPSDPPFDPAYCVAAPGGVAERTGPLAKVLVGAALVAAGWFGWRALKRK